MKSIANKMFLKQIFAAAGALTLVSCQTVQTTQSGAVGVSREQRMAVPAEALEQAAREQYGALMAQERQKGALNRNPSQVERVRAVANRIVPQTTIFRPDARAWAWEVNILSSPEVNAWCMPGGKMAVYTGLIEKLNITDDELAAVMGHEIAHALREHARERASEQAVAGTVISVGAALMGLGDLGQKSAEFAYMGLLGLPNSRRHETEADRVGIELAARAGYDPRAAVSLWQKMGQVGGGEPIKFLSTHPSQSDRLADLTAYSQRVMPLYEQSRKQR